MANNLEKLFIHFIYQVTICQVLEGFNQFILNAPFLYPLKTSENLIVF